ncbi:MAG: hypothetical protein HKL90_16455 [Elusimicrobia bacterium]|nr:hypothetical protein [Elusimicrobiota bacterium]
MEASDRLSRLERLRRRLREAGRAAARTQAAVLFTLAYVLVIGPAALIGRLFGADLLSRRRAAKTGWIERPARSARESLDGAG